MPKKKLILIIIIFLVVIVGVIIGVILYMNGTGEKIKEVPSYVVRIEDLYCNIKDSKKMIKVGMVIETSDEKLKETIESKKFLIRDLTNEIIVSKTEESLLGENGQSNLKKEILEKLMKIFESQEITNIYFNDFIIQ